MNKLEEDTDNLDDIDDIVIVDYDDIEQVTPEGNSSSNVNKPLNNIIDYVDGEYVDANYEDGDYIDTEYLDIEGLDESDIDVSQEDAEMIRQNMMSIIEDSIDEGGFTDLFKDLYGSNLEDVIEEEYTDSDKKYNTMKKRSLDYLLCNQTIIAVNRMNRFAESIERECNKYIRERNLDNSHLIHVVDSENIKAIIYMYRIYNLSHSDIVQAVNSKVIGMIVGKKVFLPSESNQFEVFKEMISNLTEILVSITITRFNIAEDLKDILENIDILYSQAIDKLVIDRNEMDGETNTSIALFDGIGWEKRNVYDIFLKWYEGNTDSSSMIIRECAFENFDLFAKWTEIYGEAFSGQTMTEASQVISNFIKLESKGYSEFKKSQIMYSMVMRMFDQSHSLNKVMYTTSLNSGISSLEYLEYNRIIKDRYGVRKVVEIKKIKEVITDKRYNRGSLFTQCQCGCDEIKVDGILSEVNLIDKLEKDEEVSGFIINYKIATARASLPLDTPRTSTPVDTGYGSSVAYLDSVMSKGMIYQNLKVCPKCGSILVLSEYNYRVMFEHMKRFLSEQSKLVQGNLKNNKAIPSLEKIMSYDEDITYVEDNNLILDIVSIDKPKTQDKFNSEYDKSEMKLESNNFIERLKYATKSKIEEEELKTSKKFKSNSRNKNSYNNFLLWFLKSNYKTDFTSDNLLSISLRYFYGSKIDEYGEKVRKTLDNIRVAKETEAEYKKYLESMGMLKENSVDLYEELFNDDIIQDEITRYSISIISIVERCIIFSMIENGSLNKDNLKEETKKAIYKKIEENDIVFNMDNIQILFGIIEELESYDLETYVENSTFNVDRYETDVLDLVKERIKELYITKFYSTRNFKEKVMKCKGFIESLPEDTQLGMLGDNILKKISRDEIEIIIRGLGLRLTLGRESKTDELLAPYTEELRNKIDLDEIIKLAEIFKESDLTTSTINLQIYIFYLLSIPVIKMDSKKLILDSNLINDVKNNLYYKSKYLDDSELEGLDIPQIIEVLIEREIYYRAFVEVQSFVMEYAYEVGKTRIKSLISTNFESIFKEIVSREPLQIDRGRCFSSWFYKELNKTALKPTNFTYDKVCKELKNNHNIDIVVKSISNAPYFKLSRKVEGPILEHIQHCIWVLIKLMDNEYRETYARNMVQDLRGLDEEEKEYFLSFQELQNVEYSFDELFKSIFSLPPSEIDCSLDSELEDAISMSKWFGQQVEEFCELTNLDNSKKDIYKLLNNLTLNKNVILESDTDRLLKTIQKISICGSSISYKISESIEAIINRDV